MPDASSALDRPRVRGKFLFLGDEKFYVRGVTYGPFGSGNAGDPCGRYEVVTRDFAAIAANGLNAIRTYTVPPRWFLDQALEQGLKVMVGLAWEQHVTFLDDAKRVRDIEKQVARGVSACAGHPAVLCYAIANEIPATIARWHGRRRIESYLRRLYLAAKNRDPEGVVTYVNYPTTEYLQLPFLDLVCFNVYLESQDRLEAYVARLQNVADSRPLILAELGLDSFHHGEAAQARSLDWQVRTALSGGCAGAFVFSWTDEWHRGGQRIDHWGFGLTDRNRRPKLALARVRHAFQSVPIPRVSRWPRISVVVCTYNGAKVIRDCLEGLRKLNYPDFEVIVVNDGSTDGTDAIVGEYDVRLINAEHRGLSCARNTGLELATGEIVAYIDDDAWPDPHWLTYLAHSFMTSDHAGVGGPNLPPDDGFVATCVASAAGGPVHVLLSDRVAEHIPGCNMAFRKSDLVAAGGFDPQFRIAGDDVDICWKIQSRGRMLGFNPAAVVWHRRRGSVGAYWKQQVNYGKSEALLEKKWPEKYNAGGQLSWAGRIYDESSVHKWVWSLGRIYQGTWGSAPFQSIYAPASGGLLWSLMLMPEWYLVIAALGGLSVLGIFWAPLSWVSRVLLLSLVAPLSRSVMSSITATRRKPLLSLREKVRFFSLTAWLNLLQPMARLWGHLHNGLTPWRRGGAKEFAWPLNRTFTIWSGNWRSPTQWLEELETILRGCRLAVLRGGDYDRWDFEVQGGALGMVHTRMAIEEHGSGKQVLRFFVRTKCRRGGLGVTLLLGLLGGQAAADQSWFVAAILGSGAALLVLRMFRDLTTAMGTTLHGLRELKRTVDTFNHRESDRQTLDDRLKAFPRAAMR
ncbi:MAG TPA: glycosyltransferase [Vicinamibacteria bacterium]|nr:glycosyltransferase [Vicinamibacteria bacterium]